VHDASLTHRADSHCPLCRGRECSDQYCTCAGPAATPDQNGTSGRCSIAAAAPRVLGGGANSPPCNLLHVDKITFGHGVMSSGHSTISRPHTALKRYEQRVHTMDQLMVSFQRWAGSADEDINLFLVGGKNYSWQLHEGRDGEIDGLGSKIGPKP
jgi:hypothetical protein